MSYIDPAPESSRTGRVPDQRTVPSYTPHARTRELTDCDGVRWTVREIVPDIRTTTQRTLLTRPGYEHGWLSFRSESITCRIAPFPAHWRSLSDYELERWCMKARDAARVRRGGR